MQRIPLTRLPFSLHVNNVAFTPLASPYRNDARVEVHSVPQLEGVAVSPQVLDILGQGDVISLLGREPEIAKCRQLLRRDERRVLVRAEFESPADVGFGFEEDAAEAVLGHGLEGGQTGRST